MGRSASKLSPEQSSELQKVTKFDKRTLQAWHKSFIHSSPSGTLTPPEFTRIYRQFFPFGDPGPFAEHVFRAFDEDNNGAIDFREFIIGLSVSSRGTPDEKLGFAFKLYDVNRDGYISRNEMLLVVDSIYKMVGSMVQLPEDEKTPEQRVDKIFSAFDMNRDGRISSEEFRAGAKRDPSILRAIITYDGIA